MPKKVRNKGTNTKPTDNKKKENQIERLKSLVCQTFPEWKNHDNLLTELLADKQVQELFIGAERLSINKFTGDEKRARKIIDNSGILNANFIDAIDRLIKENNANSFADLIHGGKVVGFNNDVIGMKIVSDKGQNKRVLESLTESLRHLKRNIMDKGQPIFVYEENIKNRKNQVRDRKDKFKSFILENGKLAKTVGTSAFIEFVKERVIPLPAKKKGSVKEHYNLANYVSILSIDMSEKCRWISGKGFQKYMKEQSEKLENLTTAFLNKRGDGKINSQEEQTFRQIGDLRFMFAYLSEVAQGKTKEHFQSAYRKFNEERAQILQVHNVKVEANKTLKTATDEELNREKISILSDPETVRSKTEEFLKKAEEENNYIDDEIEKLESERASEKSVKQPTEQPVKQPAEQSEKQLSEQTVKPYAEQILDVRIREEKNGPKVSAVQRNEEDNVFSDPEDNNLKEYIAGFVDDIIAGAGENNVQSADRGPESQQSADRGPEAEQPADRGPKGPAVQRNQEEKVISDPEDNALGAHMTEYLNDIFSGADTKNPEFPGEIPEKMEAALLTSKSQDFYKAIIENRTEENLTPEQAGFLKLHFDTLSKVNALSKNVTDTSEPQIHETVDDGNSVRIKDVGLKEKQSTHNGCWSCSMQILLQSRGIDLEQEEIRAFRPDFTAKERSNILAHKNDPNSVFRSLNSDVMENVFDHADLIQKTVPNTAVRNITYKPITEPLRGDVEQDMIQNIQYAIKEKKSPVSVLKNGHYVTVVGITDGWKLLVENSSKNSPEGVQTISIQDFMRNASSCEMTWLENLEVTEEGKVKGIPKEFDGIGFEKGNLQINNSVREVSSVLNHEGTVLESIEILNNRGNNRLNLIKGERYLPPRKLTAPKEVLEKQTGDKNPAKVKADVVQEVTSEAGNAAKELGDLYRNITSKDIFAQIEKLSESFPEDGPKDEHKDILKNVSKEDYQNFSKKLSDFVRTYKNADSRNGGDNYYARLDQELSDLTAAGNKIVSKLPGDMPDESAKKNLGELKENIGLLPDMGTVFHDSRKAWAEALAKENANECALGLKPFPKDCPKDLEKAKKFFAELYMKTEPVAEVLQKQADAQQNSDQNSNQNSAQNSNQNSAQNSNQNSAQNSDQNSARNSENQGAAENKTAPDNKKVSDNKAASADQKSADSKAVSEDQKVSEGSKDSEKSKDSKESEEKTADGKADLRFYQKTIEDVDNILGKLESYRRKHSSSTETSEMILDFKKLKKKSLEMKRIRPDAAKMKEYSKLLKQVTERFETYSEKKSHMKFLGGESAAVLSVLKEGQKSMKRYSDQWKEHVHVRDKEENRKKIDERISKADEYFKLEPRETNADKLQTLSDDAKQGFKDLCNNFDKLGEEEMQEKLLSVVTFHVIKNEMETLKKMAKDGKARPGAYEKAFCDDRMRQRMMDRIAGSKAFTKAIEKMKTEPERLHLLANKTDIGLAYNSNGYMKVAKDLVKQENVPERQRTATVNKLVTNENFKEAVERERLDGVDVNKIASKIGKSAAENTVKTAGKAKDKNKAKDKTKVNDVSQQFYTVL